MSLDEDCNMWPPCELQSEFMRLDMDPSRWNGSERENDAFMLVDKELERDDRRRWWVKSACVMNWKSGEFDEHET